MIVTREAWLTKLIVCLAEFADELNLEAGQKEWREAKASCGYGANKTRKRLFDVVPAKDTADGRPQIYIAPTIHTNAEVIPALFGALAVIHSGSHKTNTKDYKKSAETLTSMLEFAMLETDTWDEYPQAAVTSGEGGEKEATAQSLLKVVCNCPAPVEKAYVVRITPKQAERGLPECPFCHKTMTIEAKQEASAESGA